ncbi:MAG: hypothetical protein A2081_01545 [Elusimicrobia bacterium GWC2_61_19]|nr:MAG: hypothetical protein A2081_01545 [Elusimicrobia bacterium GWC2_61_19]
MNDNLPDINFKEKKEKKRGALGWLRSKLGIGSRGAMGEAGINPAAMNVGKALGGAKFGSSSAGLAGLLAGKAGIIATVAVMAVGTGVYLANKEAPMVSSSAFSSGKVADNYVPAILRSQAANQGSSLDMFKDTNKGAGLKMEADPAKAAGKQAEGTPAPEEAAAQNAEQPAPEQGNMAQEMMGKLQGGGIGSLTSSMGGGSNKFSGMGGFGNKFNQGATGAKSGFSSGIGAGFQGMPKFDARKAKMTAMKASARPVFSSSKAGKKSKFGTGSYGQAKGLRATQKSYSGTNIDSARSTQDAAWTGSTAEGDAAGGGAGVSEGGAGIMSSPSLDNGGATGGAGNPNDPAVAPVSGPEDVSPWKGKPEMALSLITVSLILSAIASYLISIGKGPLFFLAVIGYILAAIALVMALQAMKIGMELMSSHGQKAMGMLYMAGGGCAVGAAILAFAGSVANNAMQLAFSLMAAAAVLIGSMLGGGE